MHQIPVRPDKVRRRAVDCLGFSEVIRVVGVDRRGGSAQVGDLAVADIVEESGRFPCRI